MTDTPLRPSLAFSRTHAAGLLVALGLFACQGPPTISNAEHALAEEADHDDDPAAIAESEILAEHPHSPWFRAVTHGAVSCPTCGGSYDDAANSARLQRGSKLTLTALDGGEIHPFRQSPDPANPDATPDFFQLSPLHRYRLDLTPPADLPYEPASLVFDTGRARETWPLSVPLEAGIDLTTLPGQWRTAADGSLVAFDRERVVRVSAGGPAPFDLTLSRLDSGLVGAQDATFAPSGDLLVQVGREMRVVDRATWTVRPGAVGGAVVAVFPRVGIKRALLDSGALVDWSSGTLRAVGQLTADASLEPIEPVPLQPYAWSGDGRYLAHYLDGNLVLGQVGDSPPPPFDFDGPQRPPGVGYIWLGHDGQTTYYLGREGLQGCPGGCDLFVNGRRATAGFSAFAVSASRPGGVGLFIVDQQPRLRVHVPDRVDTPGLPMIGGFDDRPSPVGAQLVPCTKAAWLDAPGTGQPIRPWLSTDEALILQDNEKLVVVDAANGDTLLTVPGQWSCHPREDGSLVLRTAGNPEYGDLACPPTGCRLLVLPPGLDRIERDIDLYAEGLPLAGGARRVHAHPTCGAGDGNAWFCSAVVLRGGSRPELVPAVDQKASDLYAGSPLPWLDAPCYAYGGVAGESNRAVRCAR